MVPETPQQPSPALASPPQAPLPTPLKIWRSELREGHRAEPEDPHKYKEERNHITKQLLPLAQPRPVGAVARVHVIARLRDRFLIKPVRLV